MVAEVRCASCGAINVSDARFCTNCGRAVGGPVQSAAAPQADWSRQLATPNPPSAARANLAPMAGARFQAGTRDRLPLAAGSFIGIGFFYALVGLGAMVAGNTLSSAITAGAGFGGSGMEGLVAAILAGFGAAFLFLGAVAVLLGILLLARPRPWVRVAAIATAVIMLLNYAVLIVGTFVSLFQGADVVPALIQLLIGLVLGGLFAWVLLILIRTPIEAHSVT